jgi:hypothetical protein
MKGWTERTGTGIKVRAESTGRGMKGLTPDRKNRYRDARMDRK